MKSPLVSIVVVNWNGLDDTRECLGSLRKLNYPNYEIIVVDNGSRSDKAELEKIKDIRLVALAENTGFTGGHIAGLEASRGEYIALINNDLVLDPDWLKATVSTMQRHNDAAVVGGRNYYWNDKNPVYEEKNGFFTYQEVDPLTGQTRTLLTGEEECAVDSISGAALLIKRSVIDKLGYLDNDFFAYYEETDLIARFKRAGYEAYYTPDAKVWHKVAASSEGGEAGQFYLYMMHRNRYMFSVKNLDAKYLKKFKSTYNQEVRKSLARWIVRRDLESTCRLKAYYWLKRHHKKIWAKRKQVQKLGETYVGHLGKYKPTDVTIIIPCYNYGQYVAEAIDSALSQTLQPKKIIIINDGSTDDSRKVIDKYKNNKKIHIIHKSNQGVVAAKNLGVELSKTYWTVFLDADDYIDKKYLQKLVELGNSKRADVVYTDMRYFGAVEDIFVAPPFSIFQMLQRNFVHNSALLKTSLVKQVSGYKEAMKGGLEDWELYLSLVEIGAKFTQLNEPVFFYRQHESKLNESRNQAVLVKERQLYQRLIVLHPALFRRMGPRRRRSLRAVKLFGRMVRHPGVWLVVIRTVPLALKNGFRTILHEIRLYLTRD